MTEHRSPEGNSIGYFDGRKPGLCFIFITFILAGVCNDQVMSSLSFLTLNCTKIPANSTHNSLCTMFLKQNDSDRKIKNMPKNFEGSVNANYDVLVVVVKVAESMIAQICIRRLEEESNIIFQTYKYKKDGGSNYCHQDNGIQVSLTSHKKCTSDILQILLFVNPKVILSPAKLGHSNS